jgi:hypothetical protein
VGHHAQLYAVANVITISAARIFGKFSSPIKPRDQPAVFAVSKRRPGPLDEASEAKREMELDPIMVACKHRSPLSTSQLRAD